MVGGAGGSIGLWIRVSCAAVARQIRGFPPGLTSGPQASAITGSIELRDLWPNHAATTAITNATPARRITVFIRTCLFQKPAGEGGKCSITGSTAGWIMLSTAGRLRKDGQ